MNLKTLLYYRSGRRECFPLPNNLMRFSRHHRILVTKATALRMFGRVVSYIPTKQTGCPKYIRRSEIIDRIRTHKHIKPCNIPKLHATWSVHLYFFDIYV